MSACFYLKQLKPATQPKESATKKHGLPRNALNPENLQNEISTKGKETDSGLELYRQLSTRNAVIEFYESVTGNRDVALAILEYADIYNIPIALAFSLAFNESRYKVRAVNGNSNASVDRGLFQLNSESFPGFTEADYNVIYFF